MPDDGLPAASKTTSCSRSAAASPSKARASCAPGIWSGARRSADESDDLARPQIRTLGSPRPTSESLQPQRCVRLRPWKAEALTSEPRRSRLVAASVEIHAGVGNSVADRRRRGAGLAGQYRPLFAADRVWRLPADHRHRAGRFRLQPARLGRRPRAVVHQRGGIADPGDAGFRHFRQRASCCWPSGSASASSSAACRHDVSAISDPHLPGGWSIFVGVISLLAGIDHARRRRSSRSCSWRSWSASWLVVIGVFEIVSSFGIRKAAQTSAVRRPKVTSAGASPALLHLS